MIQLIVEIVPAIIAKNFEELERKIRQVEPYVKSVQIDIMDGIFVSNKTWNNPEELKNIKTNLEIEAHLMVEDVVGEAEKWLNSGVKRILAHWEAMTEDLRFKIYELRKKIQEKGIEFGIVLNLETPINVLSDFSSIINYQLLIIQLMSIAKIGAHGYPFSEEVIPKIKALREKYPDVKISVDGGINLENAKRVKEAGADILVVGSTIFESKDIGKIINGLKS